MYHSNSNRDIYLMQVLTKWKGNITFTNDEIYLINFLKEKINQWEIKMNKSEIEIRVLESGSKAKGDAIKGKSDIDLFVSIYDPNNLLSIENYYDNLYSFLKENLNANVIKQNVSIGINCNYKNKIYNIDITPGKIINYSNIYESPDHFIYSNKERKRILTNIMKHIDLVKYSPFKNEIMLMKIWKNNHKLDIPSIAIEILVINILSKKGRISIYENIMIILQEIKNSIMNIRIVDPSNKENIISDDIHFIDKLKIKEAAEKCLNQGNFGIDKIIW